MATSAGEPLYRVAGYDVIEEIEEIVDDRGGAPVPLKRMGKAIVIDMDRMPARIADQEDAIVPATGMAVRDIGVGAFHPPGQVRAHEQVEDA
ncbi:hypothetical protein OY671_010675, partial [Metschnikowia pulcherrima]